MAGAALAAIPNPDGSVDACYCDADGRLRVIDVAAGEDCKSRETALGLAAASGGIGAGGARHEHQRAEHSRRLHRYDDLARQRGRRGRWLRHRRSPRRRGEQLEATHLEAGDYIELVVSQNSGSALDSLADSNEYPFLAMARLGP